MNNNYIKEIANELSEMFFNSVQRAFKKGWEKGFNDFNPQKSTFNYKYYSDFESDQITALQSSLKEKEKECEELKAWKQSAIEIMRPLQSIGHAMDVRLGETIHDKIVPFIEKLKAENERLKFDNAELQRQIDFPEGYRDNDWER
jgi:hypothetical protein